METQLADNLAGWLERGGPVLAVLLALSVAALAIVLVKLYQLLRQGVLRRAWLEPALSALRGGEPARALALARAQRGPVARVFASALSGRLDPRISDETLREEILRVGRSELSSLSSNLRGLESIATLAPLLGLLGTVLGMIRAFMRLEEAGSRVDPAILSGGIWEALLTTAVGLAIAIPVMAVLSWLESVVDQVRETLSDAVTQILSPTPQGASLESEDAAQPDASGAARDDSPSGPVQREATHAL